MSRLAAVTTIGPKRVSWLRAAPSHAFDLPPPLKWVGGKRWQLPHLQSFWRKHSTRRLVEPFCGGMAVTLGLRPERALLNDVNPHLINFYKWIQRGLRIEIPLRNNRFQYLRYRERFNALIAGGRVDTKEAASLFYYLNRTGYNGLCRFNQKGYFNVPFGTYKTISYKREFSNYQPLFQGYELSAIDFEELPIASEDLIYADPPYDVEFTQYSQGGFDWHDQVRTAEWLAAHPGPVIVANQATSRIVTLYKSLGFVLYFVQAPRMISCSGDRKKAQEVIGVKNM
jgi:DNA adenine methylase